jgi:hypothetical protein
MKEPRNVPARLLVVLLALAFALALLLNSALTKAKAQSGPQTPSEMWLSWSSDTRAEFVGGYVEGFVEGERQGCSFYADKITPYLPHKPEPPEKLPRLACLNVLPDFVKPTKEYVDVITNYYQKYPNDRQAGMSRILLESATPPGLTIDQIHEKLTR